MQWQHLITRHHCMYIRTLQSSCRRTDGRTDGALSPILRPFQSSHIFSSFCRFLIRSEYELRGRFTGLFFLIRPSNHSAASQANLLSRLYLCLLFSTILILHIYAPDDITIKRDLFSIERLQFVPTG